jgi:hypothetical protein
VRKSQSGVSIRIRSNSSPELIIFPVRENQKRRIENMAEEIQIPQINNGSYLAGRDLRISLEGGIFKKGVYITEDQSFLYVLDRKTLSVVSKAAIRSMEIVGTANMSSEEVPKFIKAETEKALKSQFEALKTIVGQP